jgi:hypothetical protein
MQLRGLTYVLAATLLIGCAGGHAQNAVPKATESAQGPVPLVFLNSAKKQIFVYPSSTRYTETASGVTAYAPRGTRTLAGATRLSNVKGFEKTRSASPGRTVRTYCANYTESYTAWGDVITFPYTEDYDFIVSVLQSEEAEPMLQVDFTQRDSSATLLYESGFSTNPGTGGQYEVYMAPGVDIGETAGGGAYIVANVQYGHTGDPYYNYEFGSAEADVTCQ